MAIAGIGDFIAWISILSNVFEENTIFKLLCQTFFVSFFGKCLMNRIAIKREFEENNGVM